VYSQNLLKFLKHLDNNFVRNCLLDFLLKFKIIFLKIVLWVTILINVMLQKSYEKIILTRFCEYAPKCLYYISFAIVIYD
jgi:hypothetical protein